MKETPVEKIIYENFLPGKISKTGFLGPDPRHIHDIIAEDERTSARLGLTKEIIATKLQKLIEAGKPGLESQVQSGDFLITIQWSRGKLPCPFGEPGLHEKIIATVTRKKLNKTIRFSQLSVHMIEEHGFFAGEGSSYRLEPEELARFLDT